MLTKEIIGKTVTNIYQLATMGVGGLDNAECFVELDNNFIIDIPFDHSQKVQLKILIKNAVSVFSDLSDYPVCHINKDKNYGRNC